MNNFIEKVKNFILNLLILFLILVLLYEYFLFMILPAKKEVLKNKFEIKKGDVVETIAKRMEKDGYIKSEILFRVLAKFNHLDKILIGNYDFSDSKNMFDIIDKIKSNKVEKKYLKFTIYEGEPNYLIAKKLSEKLKNVDEKKFIELAREYEGMLYPDTYNLDWDFDEKKSLDFFLKNYSKKIEENYIIFATPDEEKRVLTIASLIEAEGGNASYYDKRKISAVIYNRLEKNMLLQLDYVFFYIQKEDRRQKTPKEIERIIWRGKKIDSPYNNYKYPGLPPSPIGNPSIESIKAALDPLDTDDLYYITGKDGNFYYAETSNGHQKNIKKYLRF